MTLLGLIFQFQEWMITGLIQPGHLVATPAPSGAEVESRLESAGATIQGILTGLVVLVGVIFAIWRVITGFASMHNPHEKEQVYRTLGSIALLTAVGAAMIWIVPWAWDLMAA
ncbi:CagC family type IV secretion system protein [Thalassorhabdus alkalitolerans]|uniref:CagC family type IV secretion system protein n=1 Tax=Thalassorhabdus alkalitolerans TaxID=2282697 RepID=A0ABW0YWI1_9BACI